MSNRPTGCHEVDENLLEFVRSSKCLCGATKQPCITLCNDCYFSLPFIIRNELWRPWADGFARHYSKAIHHLESNTGRLACLTNVSTSSRQTSTSSSDKGKKKSTGTRSQRTRKSKSASVQETSQHLDSLLDLL